MYKTETNVDFLFTASKTTFCFISCQISFLWFTAFDINCVVKHFWTGVTSIHLNLCSNISILNGISFWYIVCLYVTRCLGKDLERQITFLQVDSNGYIYSFISFRNHKRSHESHILKDGFSLLQEGKYQHDIEVMNLVGCFENVFHYLLCWIFCNPSFWMIPILNNCIFWVL